MATHVVGDMVAIFLAYVAKLRTQTVTTRSITSATTKAAVRDASISSKRKFDDGPGDGAGPSKSQKSTGGKTRTLMNLERAQVWAGLEEM